MKNDMYAVKFRFKNSYCWNYLTDWSYEDVNKINSDDKYNIESYLFETYKDAMETVKDGISGSINCYGNGELAEIKIAKMNKYNLKREINVEFYRNFE